MTNEDAEVLKRWQALPRRVYLDTSTLQTLYDFSGEVFEGKPFAPSGRAGRVVGFGADLESLRRIFHVNERAQFEFVVTQASLREVDGRGRPGYSQWVRDVLDTWLIQSEADDPPDQVDVLDQPKFGHLSQKDLALLRDALGYRCDGFLTMERKLYTAAPFIQRATGLRLLRPPSYWDLIQPWAALY